MHADSTGCVARAAEWFGIWNKPIQSWLRQHCSMRGADLEDVAQETFFRALRYTGAIEVRNPKAYLVCIAANVVNEWRGRSSVRQPHDHAWLDGLTTEEQDEPEHALTRARANQHIREVLETLPPRRRELLSMHFSEGLTYKEIARARGLSLRIVKREVTQAYRQLRLRLNAEDL